jgi:hypothetical protein
MYCVAYFYEKGQLSHFNIPESHIHVSVTTLVVSVVACISALAIALKFLNFTAPILSTIWTAKNQRTKVFAACNLAVLVPAIFVISCYPPDKTIFMWCGIALLVFNFIYFGVPLLFGIIFRTRKSASELIDDSLKAEDPFDLQAMLQRRGIKADFFFLAVFGSLVLVGMGWVVGNSKAIKMTEFDVIEGTESFVVRHYDDFLLVKEFNEEKKTFGSVYAIIPVDKPVILERRKIGRLKKS